jgi:hypothetical protein
MDGGEDTPDRRRHPFRLVIANRMAALLEDVKDGSGNEAVDLFGELGRADPVVPPGEDEGTPLHTVVHMHTTKRPVLAIGGRRLSAPEIRSW